MELRFEKTSYYDTKYAARNSSRGWYNAFRWVYTHYQLLYLMNHNQKFSRTIITENRMPYGFEVLSIWPSSLPNSYWVLFISRRPARYFMALKRHNSSLRWSNTANFFTRQQSYQDCCFRNTIIFVCLATRWRHKKNCFDQNLLFSIRPW